jgi:hypothetical protein
MSRIGCRIEQVSRQWSAVQWQAVAGALIGLATGVALSRRMDRAAPVAGRKAMARLEVAVADALAADPVVGRRPIEVGALTVGIVELTGPVRDEWEAERAVMVAQRVAGVRTVLNRLDQEMVEDHLAITQSRLDAGDPSLQGTHWYGMGVGMGRRRQGHDTDPDRPSDRVPLVSRALGTDRAIEQTSERLDKLPTGVEGHTTGPAGPTDRGTVEETSHRRRGNEPVEPLQDLNPESRVQQDIKKGTEVTLGRSGVESNIVGRGGADRG